MKITVIGCGRWGSLIAWYLDSMHHEVTLYGRESSQHMQRFLTERKNDYLEIPQSVRLCTDIQCAKEAEVIVISVNSQGLDRLMQELKPLELRDKTFVLCMKGIEIGSGRRLTEIVEENTDASNHIAVWVGPGHPQEFYHGIPNCMIIDSKDEATKKYLIDAFSGKLIRFYYGQDLIGTEIGAATKNVVGVAAGMLDGAGLTTLKGALMSRGTREVGRLIGAMGGNEMSVYGLCHLGDYEATVFSRFSHNRMFGEQFVKGEKFEKLAEGYYTVKALKTLEERYGVEMPISDTIYEILYENADPKAALHELFERSLKPEFYK